MARLKDLAERVTDLLHIDPAKIGIAPDYNAPGREFNSSADDSDLQLRENIRENGITTPLVVRIIEDKAIVVRGHRRLSAVWELIESGMEIKSVPCMTEARGTSDADRNMDLINSNDNQKPLTDLAKAAVLKKQLQVYGWDEKQIALKSGMKLDRVRGLIDLLGADAIVTDMVRDGTVTATVAIKTMKKAGAKTAAVLKRAAAAAPVNTKTGRKQVTAKAADTAVKNASPAGLNARGKKQISKQDLTKTLRSILETDDIAVAHHLARITLGIRKTHLEAAENAEILKEFRIVPSELSETMSKTASPDNAW